MGSREEGGGGRRGRKGARIGPRVVVHIERAWGERHDEKIVSYVLEKDTKKFNFFRRTFPY